MTGVAAVRTAGIVDAASTMTTDADRQVDVERPPPRQVVGEQAAEQRAEHRRHAEDRAERALVLAALAQRDDVGDQRGRGDRQAAGAEALHRPPGDQPGHVRRRARRRPTRRRTSPAETWKISLRPNRSPNLPASTVAIVSASRYDDTTQDRWPAPPRSPTIVGSAVETIVWSSADEQHAEQDGDEDQVHPPPVDPGVRFRWTGRGLGQCHVCPRIGSDRLSYPS